MWLVATCTLNSTGMHSEWRKEDILSFLNISGFQTYLHTESPRELPKNTDAPASAPQVFTVHMSHLGTLFNSDSDSVDLRWGPRFCIFNKLSGDTEVADTWACPHQLKLDHLGLGPGHPESLKIPKRISFAARLEYCFSLTLCVCVPYICVCIRIYTYMYICVCVYIYN